MKYKVNDIVKVKESKFGIKRGLSGSRGIIDRIEDGLYRVGFPNQITERTVVVRYYWLLEDELDLVTPPKVMFGDGTNLDLIAEIKNYQHKINILLNRLESNLND